MLDVKSLMYSDFMRIHRHWVQHSLILDSLSESESSLPLSLVIQLPQLRVQWHSAAFLKSSALTSRSLPCSRCWRRVVNIVWLVLRRWSDILLLKRQKALVCLKFEDLYPEIDSIVTVKCCQYVAVVLHPPNGDGSDVITKCANIVVRT